MHPYWMIEEVISLVNDQNTYPFSMNFVGIFNDKTESFLHAIYPSELLTNYDSRYKDMSNINLSQSNSGLQEVNESMSPAHPRRYFSMKRWLNGEGSAGALIERVSRNKITYRPGRSYVRNVRPQRAKSPYYS